MTDHTAPTGAASPIADLSYRNYDGPLHTRAVRWWIVALAGIRLVIRKKGFWIVFAISLLPFLVVGAILYFQSSYPMMMRGNPMANETRGQVYASQFFQAYQNQSLWLFILALMAGAGSIAADNQANALLVYLSKPLTKGDYLLGKWMGIFLVVFAAAAAPAILLYLYCLLSYVPNGFLRDEPWLFFRVLAAAAVPASIHASLMIGFSAWSKTPRMAGALYAGVYFVSQAISMMTWGITTHGDLGQGVLTRHLSIPGVIDGLAQHIYNLQIIIVTFHRHRGMERLTLEAPDLLVMLALAAGAIALGVLAARARIRAVEIVKG